MSEKEAREVWSFEKRAERIKAVGTALREAAPDFYVVVSGMLLPDGSLTDGEGSPLQKLTSAYTVGCPPQRNGRNLLNPHGRLDPSGNAHPHVLWEDVSFLAEKDGVPAELVSALLISEKYAPCEQDFSVEEQLGYIRRAVQRELGITMGFVGRRDRTTMMPLLRQTASALRQYRTPEKRFDVPEVHHHH